MPMHQMIQTRKTASKRSDLFKVTSCETHVVCEVASFSVATSSLCLRTVLGLLHLCMLPELSSIISERFSCHAYTSKFHKEISQALKPWSRLFRQTPAKQPSRNLSAQMVHGLSGAMLEVPSSSGCLLSQFPFSRKEIIVYAQVRRQLSPMHRVRLCGILYRISKILQAKCLLLNDIM